MAGWFERWQKRRFELAQGADADLVGANRRRSRIAFSMIGIAVLLVVTSTNIHLPRKLDLALRILAIISLLVGVVLAKWASAGRAFLTEPEPEGPPEIFRDRP